MEKLRAQTFMWGKMGNPLGGGKRLWETEEALWVVREGEGGVETRPSSGLEEGRLWEEG